jgi:hypothetical protein
MPSPGQSVIRTLIPDSAEFRTLEHCVDTVLKIEPSDGDDFVLAGLDASIRPRRCT